MLAQLFLRILSMSFTGGIVIVCVLLARLLLKKAPKIFSYALWAAVLFRLLCPFSFESVFSLLPVRANPIGQEMAFSQTSRVDGGSVILSDSANALLPAATPASANPLESWAFVWGVVWLIGIALLLAYSLVTLLRLKRRLKTAVRCQDSLFLSHAIDTAFVLGIFRPKIYLPAGLTDALREYILLHEQTHIKRLDHLMKLLSFLVLCLHWFNPLVWIAFFASGKDMEMSCDEAVIRKLGNGVKKEYSASLLTLATGRRMVGGTPLAFGEGDTKSRIKNVLNYRKPALWVLTVGVVVVLCVVAGLMANPKKHPAGFYGVNAVILSIDRENRSMTVRGVDRDSVIGDSCILTWEGEPFIAVEAGNTPRQLSLRDFAVGDSVVLSFEEAPARNPVRAKASAIQLQPKEAYAYSAERLWNARTPHIGDNSAVRKLIGLLPVPQGMQYGRFELHTSQQPYGVDVVYSVPTELLNQYSAASSVPEPFGKNALLLLALVENADSVRTVLTDETRQVEWISSREQADDTVGSDVREYAASPEKLRELIAFSTEKTVTAEYSIAKLGKKGERLAEPSADTQALAKEMILNALAKSTVWEGVDITTLEEYYRIRQTFPEVQEVHDYYAYRSGNGTAVLQSGAAGWCSPIPDDRYEALEKQVVYS